VQTLTAKSYTKRICSLKNTKAEIKKSLIGLTVKMHLEMNKVANSFEQE
jgi:hypothetical protein